MAGPFDLTGQDIENTYQRVLQTDGTDIYDGTGSLFTISSNINTGSFVTTSSFNSYTGSNTSQFAGTASYANYAETASSALNAQDILIRVLNQSGNPITKGLVVHISPSNNSSDIPRIITASYENDNNSANTLGITNETIVNGTEGFVITEGILKGVNTSEFTSGQLIYLGPTGSIIGTAPVAPLHSVRLGQVIRHQSNNGSIYVRIDNGYELGELHDVKDTTTSSSYGDLLIKSGSIWINSRSLTGSYEITGSLKSTTGFTGSLFGTASFAVSASRAVTSSFALTSSFVTGSIFTSVNPALTASFAVSASRAVTSSFALTASFVNPLNQSVTITGSLRQGQAGNIASGVNSHAEGVNTQANGNYSHAEGNSTQAVGPVSHAEGESTTASGYASHAEGRFTIASGSYSHAEGRDTQAIGNYSHAEGDITQAVGYASHAEGLSTITSGSYSHAEGSGSLANGDYSHAEGRGTIVGSVQGYRASTISPGVITLSPTYGDVSAEYANGNVLLFDDLLYDNVYGITTFIVDSVSYNGGTFTTEITLTDLSVTTTSAIVGNITYGISNWAGEYPIGGQYSHAEGASTQAVGYASHAEGDSTAAAGQYSHAEGASTQAVGYASHAEGASTQAVGGYSHAEGDSTTATGNFSHAEGENTQAIGNYSHAEGSNTQAVGNYSHAEGFGTIASGSYQHVQGQYNIPSLADSAFIIGNGIDDNNRSNLVFASGSQFQVTGSLAINDILQLSRRTTNPANPVEGMIIASGSAGASKLYYYNNGWNALF